jgi:hypothetical protein
MTKIRKKRIGLNQRARDKSGEIRTRSGTTLISTLRKTYGDDFADGFRSDMKLETLLAKTRSKSLHHYLRKTKGKTGGTGPRFR